MAKWTVTVKSGLAGDFRYDYEAEDTVAAISQALRQYFGDRAHTVSDWTGEIHVFRLS